MREPHDELTRRAVGPKGRFRLFRPVAATRFGSLWDGEDTMGGRPVLVEVVRQPLPSTPEDRKRLRNRMAEAQDLPPHPAILTIRSIHAPDPPGPFAVGSRLRSRRGVDEDEWLLVLEPFDGTTLERRASFGGLSSGGLSSADVYAIGARVGEALQSLHAVDVAHGSISATSILVDDDGEVRLFDALVGTWWGGRTHAGPSERRGDVVSLARVVVDLVDDDHIAEAVRRAVDGEDVPLEELVTSLRAAGTAASFVRDAPESERAESERAESEGAESPVERSASKATEVEPSASERPAAPDRTAAPERTVASDRPAVSERTIAPDRPAASEPRPPRRPRRASLGAELRALEEMLEAERRRLADLEARANELRVSAEQPRRTEPRRRLERDRDEERPLRIVLPEAEGDGEGEGPAHHPNGAPRRRHPSDAVGSDRPRGSGAAPTDNPVAAPTTQVDRIVEIPEAAARVAEPEVAEPEVAEPEISPDEEREDAEERQRILERAQLFERRPSPEFEPTPDAIREHAIDVAPKEERRRAGQERRRARKQEREEARRDKRAHKQAIERMREVEHQREAATAERPAATPKRARKPEKPEKLRPSRNAQAYGVADLEPALWMKVVATVASLLMFAGLAVGAYFLFFAGP